MIFVKAQDRPRRSDCQHAAIGWTFAFGRPARAPSGPFQPDDSPPRGQKFYRSLMRRARIASRTFMRLRQTPKRARAKRAAGLKIKRPTLSIHLRRLLRRLLRKGDRVPRARGSRAFRPPRESLLRAENSLRLPCSGQKTPCSPLREFCRKNLKSKVFSTWILSLNAEFPANSLPRREFSAYAASKSCCAEASSTDPIWAHRARVRHLP